MEGYLILLFFILFSYELLESFPVLTIIPCIVFFILAGSVFL